MAGGSWTSLTSKGPDHDRNGLSPEATAAKVRTSCQLQNWDEVFFVLPGMFLNMRVRVFVQLACD